MERDYNGQRTRKSPMNFFMQESLYGCGPANHDGWICTKLSVLVSICALKKHLPYAHAGKRPKADPAGPQDQSPT